MTLSLRPAQTVAFLRRAFGIWPRPAVPFVQLDERAERLLERWAENPTGVQKDLLLVETMYEFDLFTDQAYFQSAKCIELRKHLLQQTSFDAIPDLYQDLLTGDLTTGVLCSAIMACRSEDKDYFELHRGASGSIQIVGGQLPPEMYENVFGRLKALESCGYELERPYFRPTPEFNMEWFPLKDLTVERPAPDRIILRWVA